MVDSLNFYMDKNHIAELEELGGVVLELNPFSKFYRHFFALNPR